MIRDSSLKSSSSMSSSMSPPISHPISSSMSPPMLFEVSWEVTNKVGGIYTVITSKVPLMQTHYDNYVLVGPLFDVLPLDFMEQTPPAPYAEIFHQLKEKGIRAVYGEWDIQGKPTTILIDSSGIKGELNFIKKSLWDSFGVDSLYASHDFNEPLLWSWGVGEFLSLVEKQFSHQKIIGHFHEWMSGFGLLNLKNKNSSIATVFTTHATILGRTIASSLSQDKNLVEYLSEKNVYEEARSYGVLDKYTMEKACALNSDIFTTVSKVTAQESKISFGQEPLVLPNGLALDSYPTFEGTSFNHISNKAILQQYVMSHFFPYQTFDLEQTLFYYTSGRYEFINKGMDLTIEALAKLDAQLQREGSKKTVIMFFFLATTMGGPKRELLQNVNNVDELFHTVKKESNNFFLHVVENLLMNNDAKLTFCADDKLTLLKRRAKSIRRNNNPFFSTHEMNEEHDEIISACKRAGLVNSSSNRVKIVVVPSFLNGRDGLINLNYNDAISACHLGIFPSNYEPWGYTPLESISLGVPAITTTNAGFGLHVQEKLKGLNQGVFLVHKEKSREEVLEELYSYIEKFTFFSKQNRVATKMNAHALSTYADWRQLINNYLDAHQKALLKHSQKNKTKEKTLGDKNAH